VTNRCFQFIKFLEKKEPENQEKRPTYGHSSIPTPEKKPLALAGGHGCYMTVTPERALVSVEKWPMAAACRR
jgi:hypothetical protein